MFSPLPLGAIARAHVQEHRLALSASYEETARALVELHVAPFFGDRDMRGVTRADARAFAEWMFVRGRSASTIYGACSLVRRVFNVCIEEQRLDGANPFARPGRVIGGIRRRQSSEVARVRTFTAAELAALLETARLPRFAWLYPILVFLVSTGARRGEALGLRWADVDLVRGVVAIRRARVRGRYVVPKSGREREIPLDAASPLLREVLLEAIVRGESPAPDALVFTSPRGCILQERNVHRGWYRLRRAAGVSPLRMHDLRHTFASRAIGAGVSIPRVSAWLGHAQIATTLAVYTHVLPPNREPSGFLALATTKGTDSQ